MALSKGEKKVLGAIGKAVGAGAVMYGLYYLLSGAGSEQNAALIPDSIEDKLDMVVERLNKKFGKAWGQYAIALLEQALPGPLVALVQFVHEAEQQNGLSGASKRGYARERWQQQAYA
jgi:hypothetical protein